MLYQFSENVFLFSLKVLTALHYNGLFPNIKLSEEHQQRH